MRIRLLNFVIRSDWNAAFSAEMLDGMQGTCTFHPYLHAPEFTSEIARSAQ